METLETTLTRRVFSGSPWEKQVGYCRALRHGNLISISGTAPVAENGTTFEPHNAYAQTKQCLEIIEKALSQLDSTLSDIVRTRLYVTDISRWEEYGQAHAEAFGKFPPTTTMVEVKALISPEMLVEIEADAIVKEK